MFELMAVGHEGLTLDAISAIPIGEVRQPLMEWLDHGARAPMRIATDADADILRRMQESLALHGVRTQIRKAARDISAAFAAAAEAAAAEAAGAPPTPDADEKRPPPPVSRDSGLIEYRAIMKELDQRRSSTSHVVAVTAGRFRMIHVVIIIAIAVIGVLVSLAARGI